MFLWPTANARVAVATWYYGMGDMAAFMAAQIIQNVNIS